MRCPWGCDAPCDLCARDPIAPETKTDAVVFVACLVACVVVMGVAWVLR